MDPAWIAAAFGLGLAGRLIGLPPLVGFLAAGFVLRAFGAEGGETLDRVANLGVYLLLFGIGLKLKLKSLVRPEIWGVASIHMLLTTLVFAAALLGIAILGASFLAGLTFAQAALIGFALSFSSTVFAVKVLEESGDESALHARISIGILIVQDIIAIVFLTASTGKVPSVWALGLLGLPLLRPPLMWLMSKSGHGELLVLFGVLLVFASTQLFESVQMKADLGALIAGVLVGSHPKANELSKTLMGFKDLFLVGFFLSIGLEESLTWGTVGIALALAVVMPLKVALFFFLMTKFRLRARTSLLGSAALANYSEFGLIVSVVGVANGWISSDWLLIIAVALAITFVAAAPLNSKANALYERFGSRLGRYQTDKRISGDEVIDPGDVQIIVFGMGRIGSGAYDEIRKLHGDVVAGVDHDPETVERHRTQGRRVILGDATDVDFYQRIASRDHRVQTVILTTCNHQQNLAVTGFLRARGFGGTIAATARHADEIKQLKEAGVQAAFDLFENAGAGLAEHVCAAIDKREDDVTHDDDRARPD